MRKAQIEMMGLVVVVILVTLGLFFSLALQPGPESKQTIKVYSDEELAGNFLITLLEADLEGYDLMVREVAVDCVRHHRGEGKYTLDEGRNSCEAFGNVTQHIINKTLEQWGRGYHFLYTYDPGGDSSKNTLVELGQPCTGETAAPGIQPISLFRVAPGRAVLRLDVC
mgnify:CR=1 FL=1